MTTEAMKTTFNDISVEASAFEQDGVWLPEYRVLWQEGEAPMRRPDIMGFRDRQTAVLMAVECGIYDIRCKEYARYNRRNYH
ncbi:hypothetical protein [Duganella aceris]|uniref:Uncharacterized protein n=1 Tax=Duganella aceris TaxID=2703883 RepID=A0ABX0FJ37_9BURK|nr:hypothetical protein [Duganella aceris]NGZ84532.1 hypothetical protein [Duganella aceris]